MTKKLQKCIYKEGSRIVVKTMCSDDTHKKQICFPVNSLNEGVKLLGMIREHNNDYSYGMELRKQQRVKHGLPEYSRMENDDRYIHKKNNMYYIEKVNGNSKLVWKCDTRDEARSLRDLLEKHDWNDIRGNASAYDVKKYNHKKNYARFEEVENFPRLHIPKKEQIPETKATTTTTETKTPQIDPVRQILETKAEEYNISVKQMKDLSLMIGLQQLERLNFIPEWEDIQCTF